MKVDSKSTAVISLDLQHGILGMAPAAQDILPRAAQAVQWARQSGARLIHVGLGFEAGHPEISRTSGMFARVKDGNLFVKGTQSAEFHPSVFHEGDLVVYKHRVGAFSENNLHLILQAQHIRTLVLFGVSTSGITLSTVRRAADLDYTLVVLEDACFDQDADVHRVLTQKVFPRQASVMTVEAFIKAQE